MKENRTLDAATASGRLLLSILVGIWDAANQYVSKEVTLRAEAKVLGVVKVTSITERTAMRRIVETRYGKRESGELPAASYIAEKMSEMEDNEPTASKLDEVISADDLEVQRMATGVNPQGLIQMMRTKSKTSLPSDPEQLRARFKVECNVWLMMQTKFPNRGWLQSLAPVDFEKYVDYLLGRKCNGLMVVSAAGSGDTNVPLNPAWHLVLQYDYQLRKEAFKMVREENIPLKDALEAVVKDQELKELFFLTPLSHQKKSSPSGASAVPFQETLKPNPSNKVRKQQKKKLRQQQLAAQKGKGAGKQGGKGAGKGAMTPDGRIICAGFNRPAGCTFPN